MEISSIITGVVVAALIFVPFLLMAYSGNKDVKLLEKIFNETGEKENLKFAVKEKINDTLVGIDSAQNKVLFVKVIKGKSEIELINLAKIKSLSFVCPVPHHKIDIPQKSAYFSFLSKESKAEIKVFVYNSIEHKPIELNEILKKGERWEALLNKNIVVA